MQVRDGDRYFTKNPTITLVKDKLSKRPMHVSEEVYDGRCTHRVFWAFNTLRGILAWYNDRIGNENIYFNRFVRDKCFLMIGHTRYEMPPKHEDFEDFVRHCLDIEAAFYDNQRCLEVLDKAGPKV